MSASSVTGISGNGMSNGLYKPELHCGGCTCGCHGDDCNAKHEHTKLPCSISYRLGNMGAVVRPQKSIAVRGC